MKALPGWILVGALIGGATVALMLEGRTRERIGVWKEKARVADSALAVARARQLTRDTIYIRDTITLTRTRVITDSVIAAAGDSIPKERAKGLVEAERSACNVVVRSCEERVAARDNTIGLLESRLKLEQHKPGPRRFPSVVIGGVVGTDGTVRLGVGVGVRLW